MHACTTFSRLLLYFARLMHDDIPAFHLMLCAVTKQESFASNMDDFPEDFSDDDMPALKPVQDLLGSPTSMYGILWLFA
jgi:hypothetical protein